MGLAYIAGFLLKHAFQVAVLDTHAEKLDNSGIQEAIKKERPSVVGITSNTAYFSNALVLARLVKEVDKDINVVMGGPHVTALPREGVAEPSIDVVVRGEGEHTMLELLSRIDNNTGLEDVLGITYKRGGKIIDNPPRPLIENLDELPFPAYHLLPMDRYRSPQTRRKRFANILTSRGCPYRCNYCTKNIFGYRFRARSVPNIIGEIRYLMDEYGISELHILDDVFTLDRKRVSQFCEAIKDERLAIVWKCGNGVRVDTVDKDMLQQMKEAGCYSLSFGIESGNQKVLNNIGKKQTLEQCRKAVNLCREVGIFTVGFFMLGNLGENAKTMQETIEFAKSLKLDAAQFAILVPLPGTELYDIIKSQGEILTKRWEFYATLGGRATFQHGELTKPLMERMFIKAHREFYLRPSYLWWRLARIRSWSDIWTYFKTFLAIIRVGR